MTDKKPNHRSVTARMLIMGLLMLALGLTHRTLAARLGVHTRVIPIAQEAMQSLPLQIGNWMGQDVPLDAAIARGTSADAFINRGYARGASESVFLYVACGVDTCELMMHRPDVCYAAAGWTPSGHEAIELPLDDGTNLSCSILQFVRGDLGVERVTILHYFIVDGQRYGRVSLFRSKVWRLLGATDYIAQIEVLASTKALTSDSSAELVRTFARESAPSIGRLFENLGNARTEDVAHPIQEGQ